VISAVAVSRRTLHSSGSSLVAAARGIAGLGLRALGRGISVK
jgi:hypothetical protein